MGFNSGFKGLILLHNKTIYTDRSVEKADFWNLFFAAVAYSTWQNYSCQINFRRKFICTPRVIYVTGSLLCSQKPATFPGLKPGESSPHSIIFLKLRHNIILTSTSRTFKRSVFFRLEERKISRWLYQASLNNISTVGNCCRMVYFRPKAKMIPQMHLPFSERQCQS